MKKHHQARKQNSLPTHGRDKNKRRRRRRRREEVTVESQQQKKKKTENKERRRKQKYIKYNIYNIYSKKVAVTGLPRMPHIMAKVTSLRFQNSSIIVAQEAMKMAKLFVFGNHASGESIEGRRERDIYLKRKKEKVG